MVVSLRKLKGNWRGIQTLVVNKVLGDLLVVHLFKSHHMESNEALEVCVKNESDAQSIGLLVKLDFQRVLPNVDIVLDCRYVLDVGSGDVSATRGLQILCMILRGGVLTVDLVHHLHVWALVAW